MEPVITVVPAIEELGIGMAAGAEAYATGDREAATMLLLEGIGGSDPRESFAETLPPDWLEQAIASVGTAMEVEAPALGAWAVTPEQVGSIGAPCLAVVGDQTGRVFADGIAWPVEHLRHVEQVTVPAATHMLQVVNPDSVARSLGDFLRRHPMGPC